MGHTRILMMINLVAAVLNAGLNIVLIPDIGLFGAAIGTSVALLLRNFLRLTLLYRKGSIHAVKRSLFEPIALTASFTVAISSVLGPLTRITLVGILVALYSFFIISFVLTGNVSKEDSVLITYVATQAKRANLFMS
jgi:O-antigen/teichoic acid export membrane protein